MARTQGYLLTPIFENERFDDPEEKVHRIYHLSMLGMIASNPEANASFSDVPYALESLFRTINLLAQEASEDLERELDQAKRARSA